MKGFATVVNFRYISPSVGCSLGLSSGRDNTPKSMKLEKCRTLFNILDQYSFRWPLAYSQQFYSSNSLLMSSTSLRNEPRSYTHHWRSEFNRITSYTCLWSCCPSTNDHLIGSLYFFFDKRLSSHHSNLRLSYMKLAHCCPSSDPLVLLVHCTRFH